MSKFWNWTLIIIVSLFIVAFAAKQSQAGGPISFSDGNKLSDAMLMMSVGYAYGMTAMENDWTGTIQLTESVIAAQLVGEGIKSLELEQRPDNGDWKSLPSGHATGAFSAAMFVHKRYGWKQSLVPYAMAITTGYGRVKARAHYWHDVLAGAAVSALFTWVFVDDYLPKGLEVSASPEQIKLGFRTVF